MFAQLDLFLDNPAVVQPKTELCKGWISSIKNDCGVFQDTHRSSLTSGKNQYEVKMALLYPYIYYAFSFQNNVQGCSSPCMEDDDKFSVFDDPNEIKEHLVKKFIDFCPIQVPYLDVVRCVKGMVDQL